MNRLVRAGMSLAFVLVLSGCARVPGTGRVQLNMMSAKQEIQLGDQAYEQVLGDIELVTDGHKALMVARLGQRIAEAAIRLFPDPAEQFNWQIALIDEPETANAWCLPGGKMAVYTGLLPITQDEASLAAVVGHEVAHAIAHHGAERMSQARLINFGMLIVGESLGDMSPAGRDGVMGALGVGVSVGAMLPFSRKHETEADRLGIMLAADAGYNPRAAVGLWERMAEASQGKPPEILSTHPHEATRIADLQDSMPEALSLYQAAKSAGR